MTEQDAPDAETEVQQADADDDGDADEAVAEAAATEDASETDEAADVDEELIERVASSDPETVATELSSLRSRVDDLEAEVADLEGTLEERDAEIEDLESRLKRKQADFQNFKKRMEKRREEQKRRATEDLVTRLVDVRDNLVRALEQDEDVDIRDGVESTLRQFDDVLDGENVDVVDPDPGSAVDPEHHQVLARVESDQPSGTIADVHRPGYVMADTVIREAQVTVSEDDES